MAILDEVRVPAGAEVEAEACAVLLRALGMAKAAIFLRSHQPGTSAYLEWKNSVFAAESVASLAAQIEAERDAA